MNEIADALLGGGALASGEGQMPTAESVAMNYVRQTGIIAGLAMAETMLLELDKQLDAADDQLAEGETVIDTGGTS